jgi:arginine/lysine/ornithine decarboxylase
VASRACSRGKLRTCCCGRPSTDGAGRWSSTATSSSVGFSTSPPTSAGGSTGSPACRPCTAGSSASRPPAELDELKVFVDVTELGISGYQAADRLRRHHAIDLHLSDHRRVEAMPTLGDDEHTVASLLAAWRHSRPPTSTGRPRSTSPAARAGGEALMLPRDAFFAPSEDLSAAKAVGRVCAEQITPYPPGIPALLPGERVTGEIVDYLQSGVHAGMVIPDAADPEVGTVRVVA